jgi:hypothetical protein
MSKSGPDMTIRSSARLAVARDLPAAGQGAAGRESEADEQQHAGVDRLAAAVPADVIVLYTTVLGVLASSLSAGSGTYLPLRWSLYFGCVLAIVVSMPLAYRLEARQSATEAGRRRFPVAEVVTALWSFAVWGLVVPASPLYVLMGPPTLPVVVGSLTAVGVYVLTGILGPLLGRQVKPVNPANPDEHLPDQAGRYGGHLAAVDDQADGTELETGAALHQRQIDDDLPRT